MNYVDKAFGIARKAHEGQFDKSGKPYIEHPKRVAEGVHGEAAKAVAYLHDVIEDTDVELEDLRKAGIPEEVIVAVEAMTHRDGEDYFDYIERLKKNPLAREVKQADLNHNMDMSRIPDPGEADYKRLEKYKEAKRRLED